MATKKKKLFKKVRLKTIFLLALTLASNSFAWFIYSTEVSSSISTRVREWKVTFDVDGQRVEKEITINIDSLYPGMPTHTEIFTASNTGESKATFVYEVKEANILGDNLLNTITGNDKVLEYLETAYPFKVKLSSSNNSIEVNSQEQITIEVSWPYESGNDELDTYKRYYNASEKLFDEIEEDNEAYFDTDRGVDYLHVRKEIQSIN